VDGLDCCTLFKRYLPVIHTEPSIAIHKLPAGNKDPNNDNPPEWEVIVVPPVFEDRIAFRNKDKPRLLKAVHQYRGLEYGGSNATAVSNYAVTASFVSSLTNESSGAPASTSVTRESLSPSECIDDVDFDMDLECLDDDTLM
jgi:hypothetical protein